MRSVWIQIILLLVYVSLVFFVSRLIDLVLWYHHGMPSTQIVDPLLLSVRQLKQLLENRGVSYTGCVEKKELAQLAEAAAHIVLGEIEELGQGHIGSGGDASSRERLPVPPTPSYFTGGLHFYEEVEDTKDSVWLVQVVPAGGKQIEPLLDDYSWRVVCNHVAPFAIRTGIFDCRLDRRLCTSKNWHHPLLLLALPKGTRAKDKVIMKTFTATRPQTIVEWVRDQLSIRVNTINSFQDLKENWLRNGTEVGAAKPQKDVRVLLFTHLLHPPLFLAALSIKFTGRIKFGMFSVKKSDSETMKKLKQMDINVPSYIIITPEHRIVYGKRKFEHFNFNSMNRFLRVVQPEMNDVFLFSLVVINLLVGLQIFQVSVHLWWKHLVRCLWTLISYNFWLFVTWLIILAMYRFSVVDIAADKCLVLVRFLSLTEVGSLVRTDWQVFLAHPYLVLFTFFLYGALSTWLLKLHSPDNSAASTDSDHPWWEVLPGDSFWMNCFFRPMATLSRPLPPSDLELEEGIEMLLERLAVPNLWLHPVISNDYIKDLPLWKFRGWDTGTSDLVARYKYKDIKADSPEAVQWLMDSEDVPKEHHRAAGNICRCSSEDGEGSQCDPSHHKQTKTESDTSQESACICKSCGRQLVRYQRAKGSVAEGLCTYKANMLPLRCVTSSDEPSGNSASEGNRESSSACVSEDSSDEGSGTAVHPPTGMIPTSECAVCLETYTWGVVLCGLPCGHSYHQACIMLWLQRDNHHCPVCRWPAYRSKHRAAIHLHRE